MGPSPFLFLSLIHICSARALSVTDAAFDALFAAVCAYSVHTHMGTLVEGCLLYTSHIAAADKSDLHCQCTSVRFSLIVPLAGDFFNPFSTAGIFFAWHYSRECGALPCFRPVPVSYTHLDVYKRQVCAHSYRLRH